MAMTATNQFDYLREVGRKYGIYYFQHEFNAFVANATDVQLTELANAYETIAKNDDAFRISRWGDQCADRKSGISWEESEFARQVGQLFVLFGRLADHRIPPFSSRKVEFIEVIKKPNWNNLPKELEYLIDVSEQYGIFDSEDEVLLFLDSASEGDLQILARTAATIRSYGHKQIIDAWIKRFDFSEHQESWMVSWLLCLMDQAGLEFESHE